MLDLLVKIYPCNKKKLKHQTSDEIAAEKRKQKMSEKSTNNSGNKLNREKSAVLMAAAASAGRVVVRFSALGAIVPLRFEKILLQLGNSYIDQEGKSIKKFEIKYILPFIIQAIKVK